MCHDTPPQIKCQDRSTARVRTDQRPPPTHTPVGSGAAYHRLRWHHAKLRSQNSEATATGPLITPRSTGTSNSTPSIAQIIRSDGPWKQWCNDWEVINERERLEYFHENLSDEDVASDTFSDTFNVVDLFMNALDITEAAVATDLQRIVSHCLLTPGVFLDWETVPPGTRGPTNAQYNKWRSAIDASATTHPTVSPGAVMACLLEANRLRMVHRLAAIRGADPLEKGVAFRDGHIHRASVGLRLTLEALQESMPRLHRLLALAIEDYVLELRARTEAWLFKNSEGMCGVAYAELLQMEAGAYYPPSPLKKESTLWLEGQYEYRYQPGWASEQESEYWSQREKQHLAEICRRLREQGHDTSAIEDHLQ